MPLGYDPEIHFRSSLSTHIVKIPFAIIPIFLCQSGHNCAYAIKAQ